MTASPTSDVSSPPRLLLVEDDAAVRRALQLLLRARGYDVRAYAAGSALLADLDAQRQAVVLIADMKMPEVDGVMLLRALRSGGWQGPALLITGFPTPQVRADAMAAGYARVLEKPLIEHALADAVDRLVAAGGDGATTY
ncbi:response regulator transcription factor [Caulobacter sp. 602-1]|uniref:response regulator transcription factor n=1 Tax=Caulobacter sp. 602-1 TaxID=2492472 RepID=UPI000F63E83D|nr:response regulator [Caulobacter sp. 602-1]RRN61795.1 response regulator [Caulobacter sp. 602-1]